MGLELQSLALYLLIALQQKESYEGVIKYFILGAVASAFLLFGISFIYGYTGTTNFFALEDAITAMTHHHGTLAPLFNPTSIGLFVGIIFFIAGLAFKLSAAPFHMWTPDVYESSPYFFLIFLATAPKIAALGILMRLLCGPFFSLMTLWSPLLIGLALASMLIGTFFALVQEHLKRFIAYTSISSIGFSLIGLAMGTEIGLRSSLFYTLLSMLSLLGLFSCLLMLNRKGKVIETLNDLKGLSTERPLLSVILAAFILTLSGLPPFPGFFGKLYLLESLLLQESYIIASIMVLTTVVAAYYFLRLLKLMFFDGPQTLLISTPYDTMTMTSPTSHAFSFRSHLAFNYIIVFFSVCVVTGMIFAPKYLFHWISIATSALFYG
jgi:NADH-quinone oxidoreductase subunit N